MPPRGHSSSSHHSSHSSRSSHSSHSSHSSFSSGPSFHSSSSHSSSYSPSSYSSASRRTRAVKTVTIPRPARSRVNQPLHYCGMMAVHDYKCIHHDYVFYGENWTDSESGTSYEKGYYDETGERFDALIIEKDDGTYESTLECPFCNTVSKEVWEKGAVPQCKNCGANLVETDTKVIYDKIDNSTVEKTQYDTDDGIGDIGNSVGGRFKKLLKIGLWVIIGIFGLNIINDVVNPDDGISDNNGIYASSGYDDGYYDGYDTVYDDYVYNPDIFGDSVYVESLGRSLEWSEDYGSYYDPETDCYLYYNTDMEPPIWQYWYEGISSDYGNFGWMEYDFSENQWYIERRAGEWIALPEKYDTSYLWHMDEE